MGARRQVIVWWGTEVVAATSFDGRSVVVFGDGSDVDVVLPVPRFTLAPDQGGEFALGDFVVHASLTDQQDELARSRQRFGAGRWSLVSAGAHLLALFALATAARLAPTDPKQEDARRLDAMKGYLARVAEHDDEFQGGISSTNDTHTITATHEGDNASASFDDPFGDDGDGNGHANALANGTRDQTTGRHLDQSSPSDAKLARSDSAIAGGAVASPGGGKGSNHTSGTPSRLAPKVGNETALVDGKSAGPHGRIARAHGGEGGGSGSGAGGASSCAKFYGAPRDPSATWIEFELTDSAGGPVEGEPYRVTLPDGTVREGKTDARGLVCFTGIASGNAQIEWTGTLGKHAVYVGSSDRPI